MPKSPSICIIYVYLLCIHVPHSQLQTTRSWPQNCICSYSDGQQLLHIIVYHIFNPQFRLLPIFHSTCDSQFTDQCVIFCPRSLYHPLVWPIAWYLVLCDIIDDTRSGNNIIPLVRTIWCIALSCRGSDVTVYPAQRIHLRKWSTSFTLFSGEIRTGNKAGQSFSEDMAKQPVGGCWGHYVCMCTLFTRSKGASTYRCITIPATATPVPFAPLHNTA